MSGAFLFFCPEQIIGRYLKISRNFQNIVNAWFLFIRFPLANCSFANIEYLGNLQLSQLFFGSQFF